VVLSPEQLRRRFRQTVEQALPGDVELEDVRFHVLDRGRIRRAILRPRTAGLRPGGELEFRNLVLEHSPTALLAGSYRVTRITVDELLCRIDDPVAFIETLRVLLRAPGTSGGDARDRGSWAGPAIPVIIDRLAIVAPTVRIPIAQLDAAEGVVLESVSIRPEGTSGRGEASAYDVQATYSSGAFQAIELRGRIDMTAGSLTTELRASNLEVRGRELVGLSREIGSWFEELGPSGPVDLLLQISIPWQRPEDLEITGEAEAFSLILEPRGFDRAIANVSGRATFGEGGLELHALRGNFAGSELHASGRIDAPASEKPGLDLEVEAERLELALIARLPLPRTFHRALSALGIEGRADARMRFTREAGAGAGQGARFRGETALRDVSALGGAFKDVAAQAWFAGNVAADQEALALGTLRIDRASVHGVPLRAAVAKLRIDEDAIELRGGEGRLAGAPFTATARIGLATASELRLEAREVELGALAPLAEAVARAGADLTYADGPLRLQARFAPTSSTATAAPKSSAR
jgi:hypothetical protein